MSLSYLLWKIDSEQIVKIYKGDCYICMGTPSMVRCIFDLDCRIRESLKVQNIEIDGTAIKISVVDRK